MNRRNFLATCLALSAAPAIVRAESLMKLWVPPQGIILPPLATLTPGIAHWVRIEHSWLGLAKTEYFLDGVQVPGIEGVVFSPAERSVRIGDACQHAMPNYAPGNEFVYSASMMVGESQPRMAVVNEATVGRPWDEPRTVRYWGNVK